MKENKFKEKIFIAGASGMAGSAIHRKLIEAGYNNMNQTILLTPSSKELNLLNASSVSNWFAEHKTRVSHIFPWPCTHFISYDPFISCPKGFHIFQGSHIKMK